MAERTELKKQEIMAKPSKTTIGSYAQGKKATFAKPGLKTCYERCKEQWIWNYYFVSAFNRKNEGSRSSVRQILMSLWEYQETELIIGR